MKEFDFYIVPTPIGNLEDITLRAIEVLKSVDLIACEDSRVTQKLLNHFNIKTKCVSYHKYNEKERISHPGSVIVKELTEKGFSITSLPGANAVVTFLSRVSRVDEKFSFVGFLPKTQIQIENITKDYINEDFVFYESPNRIINTLKIIQNIRPDAKVAVGRELTKVFEEVVIDKIENVIKYFEENISKGEFVVMIFRSEKSSEDNEIENKIKLLQDKGFSAKDISVILSELYGFNKNKIYKLAIGK